MVRCYVPYENIIMQTSLNDSLVVKYSNNDPSAGSPTETLLRLLLPLNDQV